MFKRISALVLAVMMIAVMAVAGATDLKTTGGYDASEKLGTAGQGHDNADLLSGESINIQKALVVYNVDERYVYAPTISYTYTITPSSANKQITDSYEPATTALTKTGILTGLQVTGVSAGGKTANTPATASNETNVVNTIAWNSTEPIDAANDGADNIKNLKLDFSGVNFGAAGVYRYKIEESLATDAYKESGVTGTDGSHVRYLDVYVKDGSGTGADAWDVYGFACFYADDDITANDTAAVGKTTGFVDGTIDGEDDVEADRYYTHNVTISKTVNNDKAMENNQFPMTIIYTNDDITAGTQLGTTVSTGKATDYSRVASASVASGGLNGVATIAHEGSIKYIGIPNGTTTTVYETNNVTGTSYKTTITTDTVEGDAKVISWNTETALSVTSAAVTQSSKAYQSNTATVTSSASNADDDTVHTIEVDNTLEIISPTGIVLRVAPYMLMLGAGIALLVIFMTKRRKHAEEE